jgi:hypothetical protein
VDQPPAVDNKVYKLISISLVIISQLMKELVVTSDRSSAKSYVMNDHLHSEPIVPPN